MSVTDPTPSEASNETAQHLVVPLELATAPDFIMVRAELIRFLGGANEAILWARIHYRAKGDWWTATMEEISAETGLSVRQIRRALVVLLGGGAVEQEKLRAGGVSDHTYSYRVATKGQIDVTKRSDQDVTKRSDLPPIREVKKTYIDDSGFENAWKAWPNKNAKQAARLKFEHALRKKLITQDDLEREIIRHGEAFRKNRTPEFVPYLSTWLNQERWTDPLATPVVSQKPGWQPPPEPPRKIHDPRYDGPVNPYKDER